MNKTTETAKPPADNTAVLQKIESIEKQVSSVKERIAELEAKKKALGSEEDQMLLQLDASISTDSSKKHSKSKK